MDWTHTRKALEELENLLCCGVCGQLVQDPCSLGSCEHFFCRSCVGDAIGNSCPECGVPSHVKDVVTNRQLESAVIWCQKLSWLLLKESTSKQQGNNAHEVVLSEEETTGPGIKNSDTSESHQKEVTNSTESEKVTTNEPLSSRSLRITRKRTVSTQPLRQNTTPKGKGITPKRRHKNSVEASSKLSMSPMSSKQRCRSKGKPPTVLMSADSLIRTPVRRRLPTVSTRGSPAVSSGGTPASLKKNSKGETPLHVAVIKGDYDRVRALLEDDVPVNTKDNAGWTPLHEACNHGYVAIVELLLDHGAFINVPGCDNDTPLHDAVQNYRHDVVSLLVSRGADCNAKNIRGYKPTDLAKTDQMKEALNTEVRASQLNVSNMQVPSSMAVSQVVLLSTGLSREDRARVQKCAKLLHGRTVTDFSDQVTHLVTSVSATGQCPRTLKFLQAILGGKWILTVEWVEVCLEYESRVNEEAFEVPGCSSNPDSNAPSRARTNSHNQLPGLFDGCHFYLQGSFSYPTPSKEDLAQLIRTGCGQLLSREPRAEGLDDTALTVPYHAGPGADLADCSHYILNDARAVDVSMVTCRLCTVPATWLMDCIADFRLHDHLDGKS